MYVRVILMADVPGECTRYGRAVPSVHETKDPPLPPLFRLSERQWLGLDGAAALLGFVTTVFYLRSSGTGGPADTVLALLASAPIALRRRWPVPVLAVVAAAIGAWMALGRSSLPLSTMLCLAGYMVADRVPRRSSILALVGAEAVLAVALGVAYARGTLGAEGVQSFLPLAAAWFVGDSVSARQAYVAGLAGQAEQQRLTEAGRARQEIREQRVRIARELHDVVAHSLTVITVQAGVGRRLMARQPEQAAAALESIEATGRTAQDELRVVLGLLRDDDSKAAALGPAPGLADLKELAETVRATGTPVELRTSGIDRQLSPALELSVYRIIQEALTNVVKHAPGRHATVDLAVSARELRIEVADDGGAGTGPPPRPTSGQAARPESQHGIVGMQERVGAFSGSLVAEGIPGHGFRVIALIPLQDRP